MKGGLFRGNHVLPRAIRAQQQRNGLELQLKQCDSEASGNWFCMGFYNTDLLILFAWREWFLRELGMTGH